MSVTRTAHGLREAMFDVLDQLRAGSITQRQAKAQIEAAKAIFLTVELERKEVQLMREQIELEQNLKIIEGSDYGAKLLPSH